MKRYLMGLAALLPLLPLTAASAENIGNAGGLGVQLVLTADEKQFRQEWSRPTPPKLRVTSTVRQGESVSALLIFGGCAANAAGNCDLVSEFVLEGPDGSKVPAGGGPIWQTNPMAPGRMQLGTVSITMSFDQTDPVGDYRLSADIKDRVSGNVVSVRTGLKVTR